MIKYILKRILFLIPTLLFVSFLVYAILYAAPGDPAQLAIGEGATQAAIEAKRIELGLDKPLLMQYLSWLKKAVLHFDFGTSYRSDISVAYQIQSYFPNTLKLAGFSVLAGAAVGIPAGILASVKQASWFDNLVMSFAMIGMSVPAFVFALVMILIFSVKLRWLPPSGFSTVKEMLLPVIALGMQPMAICARMTRSSMLEVIRQDYVRTARSKGLEEKKVIFVHSLKNAMIPVITLMGLRLGGLIGGSMFVESVFNIPGMGMTLVNAITAQDIPLIQACVLLIAVVASVVNVITDIVYAAVDPRIRL